MNCVIVDQDAANRRELTSFLQANGITSVTPLQRIEQRGLVRRQLDRALTLPHVEDARGVLRVLGRLGVDARVRLLLVGSDDHRHVATVLLRSRLDEAELLDVLGETLGPLALGFSVYTFIMLVRFLFRSADMDVRESYWELALPERYLLGFLLPDLWLAGLPDLRGDAAALHRARREP